MIRIVFISLQNFLSLCVRLWEIQSQRRSWSSWPPLNFVIVPSEILTPHQSFSCSSCPLGAPCISWYQSQLGLALSILHRSLRHDQWLPAETMHADFPLEMSWLIRRLQALHQLDDFLTASNVRLNYEEEEALDNPFGVQKVRCWKPKNVGVRYAGWSAQSSSRRFMEELEIR